MNKGEVWFVEFPLEEEPTRTLNCPLCQGHFELV